MVRRVRLVEVRSSIGSDSDREAYRSTVAEQAIRGTGYEPWKSEDWVDGAHPSAARETAEDVVRPSSTRPLEATTSSPRGAYNKANGASPSAARAAMVEAVRASLAESADTEIISLRWTSAPAEDAHPCAITTFSTWTRSSSPHGGAA